jgi:hypothetical protein
LTFDAAGDLWVANAGGDSLTEYTKPAQANGDLAPADTISGPYTDLNDPTGMTLDSQGNLLVANSLGNSLAEHSVTQSGNAFPLRTIYGPDTGLLLPHGVDVDAQGNIYVSNVAGGITEYSPSAFGDAIPLTTIYGSATQLSSPQGLAVAPPLSVRTTRLPAAVVGHLYKTTLRANLGTEPYRWAIVKGKLPRGLKLSRDGAPSGTPRHAGKYEFTVRVRDSSHPAMSASATLLITVRKPSQKHHG